MTVDISLSVTLLSKMGHACLQAAVRPQTKSGADELIFMKFSADDTLFKLNPKLYVCHATGHFSKF
jgi:hypothetical protein